MLTFLMHLLILGKVMTTIEANANSCPISKQTAKPVPTCPETEKEWRDKAAKMNCAAYADQCDEPDRLEYHCVINSFINETLEVCAYPQNIVGGFCAEYSILGNVIQSNYKRKCGTFTSKPCPDYYRSNEAFKYSGCYEKAMTATTDSPTTRSVSRSSNVSETDMNKTMEDDLKTEWIIGIIAAVAVLVVLVIGIYWMKKRRQKCFRCCKIGDQQEQFDSKVTVTMNGILPHHNNDSNRQQREVSRATMEKMGLENELQSLKREVSRTTKEKLGLEKELLLLKKEILSTEEKKNALEEEVAGLKKDIRNMKEEKIGLEEEVVGLKALSSKQSKSPSTTKNIPSMPFSIPLNETRASNFPSAFDIADASEDYVTAAVVEYTNKRV